MRKIVLFLHTGYCGMDAWEFWEVDHDLSDDELYDLAWQRAVDNAESYGIYPREWYQDADEYDEEDEAYSDNIEGSFEDYVPDKHDGHRIGGDRSWSKY
jgi:hypothetical protein